MTQKNDQHEAMGPLLVNLITLTYDLQASYETATARLDDRACRDQLGAFIADHQRHIIALKTVAKPWCDTLPGGPDTKQLLTQGTLIVAHLAGDRAVLGALQEPLAALNAAYEVAVTHSDVPPDVLGTLQGHFADERRHLAWFARSLEVDPNDVIRTEMGNDERF